jgi:hypothetical protein
VYDAGLAERIRDGWARTPTRQCRRTPASPSRSGPVGRSSGTSSTEALLGASPCAKGSACPSEFVTVQTARSGRQGERRPRP